MAGQPRQVAGESEHDGCEVEQISAAQRPMRLEDRPEEQIEERADCQLSVGVEKGDEERQRWLQLALENFAQDHHRQDGDEPGEKAAQEAARRLYLEGREVKIARPPDGMDFNDLLMKPENVIPFPREAAHG